MALYTPKQKLHTTQRLFIPVIKINSLHVEDSMEIYVAEACKYCYYHSFINTLPNEGNTLRKVFTQNSFRPDLKRGSAWPNIFPFKKKTIFWDHHGMGFLPFKILTNWQFPRGILYGSHPRIVGFNILQWITIWETHEIMT